MHHSNTAVVLHRLSEN